MPGLDRWRWPYQRAGMQRKSTQPPADSTIYILTHATMRCKPRALATERRGRDLEPPKHLALLPGCPTLLTAISCL